MAIEIVDLPVKNGDFSIVMLVYQRVSFLFAQIQAFNAIPLELPSFFFDRHRLDLAPPKKEAVYGGHMRHLF
jgi:hypothetical protein